MSGCGAASNGWDALIFLFPCLLLVFIVWAAARWG